MKQFLPFFVVRFIGMNSIWNFVFVSFCCSYTQNGLLHMLDRNRRIKQKPEKFQLCTDRFDIIITAEERVYDQVIEFMESNPPVDNQPVHIINIDIQDNHEEATMGAFHICDMVSMVRRCRVNTKFVSFGIWLTLFWILGINL